MPIMGLLRRRPVEVEEARQEHAENVVRPPAGPPLVLLAPTVAGVGCFHFHTFQDAASAAVFAEDGFTRFQRSNLYAFWALHQKPEASPPGKETRGEVMVLIRESEASDTVYAVSFVDFDAADAFVRFEAKRGLNLALVSIYWAALIEVEETSRGVLMRPETPPLPAALAARPEAPARPARRVSEMERLAQQEAERTPKEPLRTEVRAEVEAVLEGYHPEAPQTPPQPGPVTRPVIEDRVAPPPVRHEPPPVSEPPSPSPAVEERIAPPPVRFDPPPVSEPPSPPPAVEERIAPPPVRFDPPPPRFEAPPAPVLPKIQEPREAVEEKTPQAPGIIAAREETPVVLEQALAQETSAVAELVTSEEGDEEAIEDEPLPDLFDVALEAAKTLRFKRWQQQDGPFHGFNSPPGRF